ncbi:Putrescine importer PuuP [Aquisphaera giovannonii]|uniref:Putrescine importer PuuP n=1 Tax=Aquisphaera giovannonii TaxID=406548 RepID=A0A5B9W1S0_9BACT|nr:amino acid permease [Aquisphaera giovannonii]QEH34141.1 Putrescine importer PuuP [Aquisphaera giovannonii]
MATNDHAEDLRDLAGFGYRQELHRSLGSFSSFAAGFSYISILTGVFQMFALGFAAAGPAFFWTWPVVLLGQLSVAAGFAELAAHYPLSGGVYQWSRRIGPAGLGWMAGWVYLASSVISLAAVALALQGTLPQLASAFQVVGDAADPADRARNAVLLGCILIALTTAVNVAGVRLMAWINNLGVMSELAGVTLLIVLLLLRAKRGPGILLQIHGGDPAAGWTSGMIGPLLAAAIMPSYVLYGFDTAGTLAEETTAPRRRAPRAILRALLAAGVAGGLLIAAGLMAADDPTSSRLSAIDGGLPWLIKEALGPSLGRLFLGAVVFAIAVCALAVHAGTVRLIFAMARDDALPFARSLALVPRGTGTPVVPAVATGAAAAAILVANVNLPRIIETLCSVAIVWANLAYLLVSYPLLAARLRGWPDSEGPAPFRLGRLGLVVNVLAVAWGAFLVVNMSWPRASIYGDDPAGKYAAALATGALVAIGLVYYMVARRRGFAVLSEHSAAAEPELPGPALGPVGAD